ncbi:MAG: hypothetical protein WC317_08035, partial [Candidatus Omnitrophota bacterium]
LLALTVCVSGRSCAADAAVTSAADTGFKRFNVYTDRSARDNHYIPSGWMGDYGDMKIDTGCKDNPHTGTTCIKIVYTGEQKQGAGWAGIFWQNPANNWGTKQGGFDLTGAKKLIFWARGERGGEVLAEVKVGGITGEYGDSDSVSIGPITLTRDWKEYTIDLTGKSLSYISGGFCWAASVADNPNGFAIFLDDIYYE